MGGFNDLYAAAAILLFLGFLAGFFALEIGFTIYCSDKVPAHRRD